MGIFLVSCFLLIFNPFFLHTFTYRWVKTTQLRLYYTYRVPFIPFSFSIIYKQFPFFKDLYIYTSPVVLLVKNPPANAGDKRRGFDPWVRKIPRRRKWQPTLGFLPRESRAQSSLVGYSPRGCKESDRLKQLSTHAHIYPNVFDQSPVLGHLTLRVWLSQRSERGFWSHATWI